MLTDFIFGRVNYNCSSANSANLLLTTPSKFNVALPEKFLNFSTTFYNVAATASHALPLPQLPSKEHEIYIRLTKPTSSSYTGLICPNNITSPQKVYLLAS